MLVMAMVMTTRMMAMTTATMMMTKAMVLAMMLAMIVYVGRTIGRMQSDDLVKLLLLRRR